MKNFKIKSTEIIDLTSENKTVNLSSISVSVKIEVDDKKFRLEFQTTETQDVHAISTELESSSQACDDYSNLSEDIDDYEEFESLLATIKKESRVQQKWNNYVAENFNRSDEKSNFLDANSDKNEITHKKFEQ